VIVLKIGSFAALFLIFLLSPSHPHLVLLDLVPVLGHFKSPRGPLLLLGGEKIHSGRRSSSVIVLRLTPPPLLPLTVAPPSADGLEGILQHALESFVFPSAPASPLALPAPAELAWGTSPPFPDSVVLITPASSLISPSAPSSAPPVDTVGRS